MIERCVRCGAPAGIKMSFAYELGIVWLEDITRPAVPGLDYPMCESHANRVSAPVGWSLVDRRRPVRPLFATLEVA